MTAAPALNLLSAPAFASAVFNVKSTMFEDTSTLAAFIITFSIIELELFFSSFQMPEPENSKFAYY